MKKYILSVVAIFLMLGAFLQPLLTVAQESEIATVAPLNPAFEAFMKQRALEKSLQKAPEEPFYGDIPLISFLN